MQFTMKEDRTAEDEMFACLQYLASCKLDVGLTSSASGRSLFLMAIHEHGAPISRIPARPLIGPALSSANARTEMTAGFISALSAAMDGNRAGVDHGLESAGEAGVKAIRDRIDGGVPPPNAPITVSGGWMRNHVSGKPVLVAGKGFNKPMYNTGALYNDFDYEITKR